MQCDKTLDSFQAQQAQNDSDLDKPEGVTTNQLYQGSSDASIPMSSKVSQHQHPSIIPSIEVQNYIGKYLGHCQ